MKNVPTTLGRLDLQSLGVIYVAYGAPYLAMAIISVMSLKVSNPGLPVCIVTNVVQEPPSMPWWDPDDGDQWIFLQDATDQNRNAKTGVYKLSPFDRTLFLDCDTMVLGDLSPLTRYLDHFDVLLSSVYNPDSKEKRLILEGKFRYREDGHFNSGVFAFRRSKAVEDFFALWNDRFHALGYRLDQPALVEAYYLGQVRMLPLPGKWNNGDKWAELGSTRSQIVIWHYKVRLEPLLEKLMIRAVGWFGGDERHLSETRKFIQSRRILRHHHSPAWLFRRMVTKIRGDQSRRLEKHTNKEQWLRWIDEQ